MTVNRSQQREQLEGELCKEAEGNVIRELGARGQSWTKPESQHEEGKDGCGCGCGCARERILI